MTSEFHEEEQTGFTDKRQLELAVETAQKTTGAATRGQSTTLADAAYQAIEDARELSQSEELTTLDDPQFVEQQQQLLDDSEHQLDEFKE
ncbi:DUF2564 family protein [Bacillus vallismortis]|uniref:DUF2564 family protein n=1 Tax=Bacillus vallismortis TaxID=72361 RepID=UPI0002895297|nr:DUF2564 family protein [Bacillus vallismortis]MBG9767808.1 hypothetical protein [Bacillus vallismortis]MEC1267019.1 DUF2564 family protein [Bacillus vallismortis]QAV08375.1 DUF2564 domain-containing protein [Bacillus vallismortis]